MENTTLSSKGQVIIPKPVRESQGWPPGTVFRVEARDGGVLLTPQPLFDPTQADQVAGCLAPPKSRARKVAPQDEAQALRRRAAAEDRATRS